MVDAMAGLKFGSVFGPVEFRAIDHQSTMGAFVGRTVLKDGKGAMADWRYADGARLPAAGRRGARAAPAELTAGALENLVLQALSGLASASSLFLVAAGLTMIFGVTRIVNFAHGSLLHAGRLPRLDAGHRAAARPSRLLGRRRRRGARRSA